ncbi:MAG: hypothetical protein AB7S77_03105 [Desulfatirhabdiaceae bacterium]
MEIFPKQDRLLTQAVQILAKHREVAVLRRAWCLDELELISEQNPGQEQIHEWVQSLEVEAPLRQCLSDLTLADSF